MDFTTLLQQYALNKLLYLNLQALPEDLKIVSRLTLVNTKIILNLA